MRIGFTCSSFDLLHAGHVQMLRESKQQCDYLLVGLQVDPTIDRPEKNVPIQSIVERYIQLSAIKFVDEIVVYSTEKDLIEVLTSFPISVRMLGEEYKDQPFTGREICEQLGIDLFFNKRHHTFSSSNLRKLVYEKEAGNSL